MSYQASYGVDGVLVHDALLAGNTHLLVGRKVTVAAGQALARGAVLGKITTGGKYVLSAADANAGSQVPDVILAEDCDASAADKTVLAYARGDFNSRALTLGAGHSVASITEGLRAKGITLLSSIA